MVRRRAAALSLSDARGPLAAHAPVAACVWSQPVAYVMARDASGPLGVGRDWWASVPHRAAAAAALSTGNVTLSAPITLESGQPGSCMRARVVCVCAVCVCGVCVWCVYVCGVCVWCVVDVC